MAITPEEAARFHNRGRDIVTKLAQAMDDFRAYARVFEIRGGKLAMGEEYGQVTEDIVILQNDLRAFFDANDEAKQLILDRFRADY